MSTGGEEGAGTTLTLLRNLPRSYFEDLAWLTGAPIDQWGG